MVWMGLWYYPLSDKYPVPIPELPPTHRGSSRRPKGGDDPCWNREVLRLSESRLPNGDKSRRVRLGREN